MAQSVSLSGLFPVVDGIDQVAALSLVLVVLFIGGRLTSNILVHHKIFLDDYAAIAGFVFFMVFTGLSFGVNDYARHMQAEDSWDATAAYFQKAVYAAEVVGPSASLTAKSSVLLLYLRIFNPSVPLRRAVAVLVGVIVLVSTPSLPLFSFYCAPNATDTMWDGSIAQNCLKANPWAALLQVVDVIINIAILILPMPSIFGLHLSLKRRLLLAFVLMHGIFGVAASIAGAVYRVNLARSTEPTAALWFRTAAFVCFEVELGMTLVSGSFHACWGFIRFKSNARGSRKSSSRPDYYYDKDGSGGSGKKMAAASETAVSEGSTDGRGARSEYRCSELGPGMRSTTALHSLATMETQGMPRTPPALQPGLQATSPARSRGQTPQPDLRTQMSTPMPASTFAPRQQQQPRGPSPESDAEDNGTTPTAELEEMQHSPAPSVPSISELEDPYSAPPGPRVVPTGRLMAEIEAAVAAAGKARLVVGTTRPHSGASFEAVDVQRVPPVPTDHLKGGPKTAVRNEDEVKAAYRRSHIAITAGVAEGYREYVVQKMGDGYVVEKAPVGSS